MFATIWICGNDFIVVEMNDVLQKNQSLWNYLIVIYSDVNLVLPYHITLIYTCCIEQLHILLTQHCYGESESITQAFYCIWYCYDSKTERCWESRLFSTVDQSVLPASFQIVAMEKCSHKTVVLVYSPQFAVGPAFYAGLLLCLKPINNSKWGLWCDLKQ